ncbi:heparin lyase I family protein [Allopontixanthobacter sp.]|uniref:heparin lyase I family protein n=1 Tax=Allopontixanthobacter sp. TaxID=2906452 RepID=UPI002AB90E2A|nr:heparin lyase I family protein [Allopontixanthobacter sp.]MDZ4307950.1 heparin lyase I family protein [Allopontixanthobacter sp.]
MKKVVSGSICAIIVVGCMSASVAIAGPRMLKIDASGSTRDTTQRKNVKQEPVLSDPISETSPDLTAPVDSSTDTVSNAEPLPTSDYIVTTSPTYTPAQIGWNGRQWRVNSVATKYADQQHSIQRSAEWKRLRFEVRKSDPASETKVDKRRSELSGSVYGDPTRLAQGVSLWGGFSTLQHAWADPQGMLSTYGIVFGQIHMGSKVGGSPALAFRRKDDGRFRITTRGEFDNAGSVRYEAPLSFDEVHDVVYNIVLHPTAGRLRVWVDNVMVVDVPKASIGHSAGDSYWNVGVYAPGGVTSPVSLELANHVYPGTASLLDRTTQRPSWPRD